MSVGRICQREVDVAQSTENVWRIAERMHQRAVGMLVVVDREGQPVGVVTDRDLVERVLARARDPQATLVTEIMSRAPQTVCEEAPIEQALSLMRSVGCRRLPVTDHNGKLVGVVSVDDLLGLICEEMKLVGELLERQTPQAAARE